MLGSATVDMIERNALPFSKKYQREYRAYPARVWVHPNFMPAGSQNEPHWDDEDQVPPGEPLAPAAPPLGGEEGGNPLLALEPGFAGQQAQQPFLPCLLVYNR